MKDAWDFSDWRGRWIYILGRIKRVHNADEINNLLRRTVTSVGPLVIAFVNAHAMNLAAASIDFSRALANADLLLRDGSGMATLFRMLKINPGLNLNGTDLIPKIVEMYDGKRISLYGAHEEFAKAAENRLVQGLAPSTEFDTTHGFHDIDIYISMALHQKADLIILGMGMPKQEVLAAELRKALAGHPCLILCGGAILDFLGGKVVRAPVWMRQLGCEWVYRLACEPRRLFSRYVVGNPVFLFRSLLILPRNPIKSSSR